MQVCTHDSEFVHVVGGACLQGTRELGSLVSSPPLLASRWLVLEALLVLLQNPLNGDLTGIGRQLVVQIAQVQPCLHHGGVPSQQMRCRRAPRGGLHVKVGCLVIST